MRKKTPVTSDLMSDYMEQSRKLYQSTQSLFGLFGATSSRKSENDNVKKDDKEH